MTDVWARVHDYGRSPGRRVIGLMTGTSADAVDAALVRFDGLGADARPVLERYHERPLDPGLRGDVLATASASDWEPESVLRLDAALGELYAATVGELLAEAGLPAGAVDAIASHGQTVRHVPRAEGGGRAHTLQIGSAAVLAERTGIAVVSDFRSRDTAAGGEGAPLVPVADALLFGSAEESRVLLNLGGMANLTYLPRGNPNPPLAFDTGPGNAVMDALSDLRTGGREPMDRGGAFAATGTADARLLDDLLADPFFALAPPRSTGRERFGAGYAQALTARGRELDLREPDIARTALELTAASIAEAITRFVPAPPATLTIYASGGGVANRTLMESLARRIAPARIQTLEALGVPSAAKEAMAFAILGHLTLSGLPGNSPAATGASRPVVLGHVTPGR